MQHGVCSTEDNRGKTSRDANEKTTGTNTILDNTVECRQKQRRDSWTAKKTLCLALMCHTKLLEDAREDSGLLGSASWWSRNACRLQGQGGYISNGTWLLNQPGLIIQSL